MLCNLLTGGLCACERACVRACVRACARVCVCVLAITHSLNAISIMIIMIIVVT